jgi:hypothetical protein
MITAIKKALGNKDIGIGIGFDFFNTGHSMGQSISLLCISVKNITDLNNTIKIINAIKDMIIKIPKFVFEASDDINKKLDNKNFFSIYASLFIIVYLLLLLNIIIFPMIYKYNKHKYKFCHLELKTVNVEV